MFQKLIKSTNTSIPEKKRKIIIYINAVLRINIPPADTIYHPGAAGADTLPLLGPAFLRDDREGAAERKIGPPSLDAAATRRSQSYERCFLNPQSTHTSTYMTVTYAECR